MEALDMKRTAAQGIIAGINAALHVLKRQGISVRPFTGIYWCFD